MIKDMTENLLLSQSASLLEVIKLTDACIFYISGTDVSCDVLGYRSKQVATPNNNNGEKMKAKGDSVERLAEFPLSPTCPLRTCFLYTIRWLMIHVAFYTGYEHSAGKC